MSDSTDPYADIRPYYDNEVSAALSRLINDDEFIHAIIKFRFAALAGVAEFILAPLVRSYLRFQWRNIRTVEDVQQHVAGYMQKMLQTTSTGFSCSGLEKLDPKQSYLFISNHRDIAMDPALVNWSLYTHGFDTVRIAIGDNLLQKPSATELMKLNKSFIVKRSIKAPREMMKAFSNLSGYIKQSLDTGHSVWIAQKEGRAKDGDDQTDPAILKMFYMHGRTQKQGFADYMASLRIVPVSISYENDPCDTNKAKELYATQTQGGYEKKAFEDIDSIVQGIVGQKKRIHIAFGEVITDSITDPESLAAIIDKQIYANYQLYPINYLAANQGDPSVTAQDKHSFVEKLGQVNVNEAKIIQTMYAMPVLKKRA